jgi:N-acetyl-anhydromuramyl-L-alanine amidase AmpD
MGLLSRLLDLFGYSRWNNAGVRKYYPHALGTPALLPEVVRLSPNHGGAIVPEAVVLHHSSGSYAGGVDWCTRPESKVSYHCLIARDGRRTILVPHTLRAWHAGRSIWRGRPDLNSWSIGVAWEGDTYRTPLEPAAIESAIQYLVPRMRALGLTVADVTDHRTVSPGRKTDISPVELARFLVALQARI